MIVLADAAPAAQIVAPSPVQNDPAPAGPPARTAHARGDPLENFNRHMFSIHQDLDRTVLRPAAMGYKHALPKFLRGGLRHFFSNLGEPIVFANFVLQAKPASAIRTAVRFFINSTVGIGGVIDVAKVESVGLPHRPNGFGDTLGFYGVKPGPYLFLPLLGPSSLRDLVGGQVDGLVLPVAVGKPFNRVDYIAAKTVITGLDQRAEVDDELKALFAGALDPYATLRSVYQHDRAGEIAGLKTHSGGTSIPDDLTDPAPPPSESNAPDPAAAGPTISAPPPPPSDTADMPADPAAPPQSD